MLPGFPGQTPTQQQFLQQFQAVNGRGVMPHNFEHILAAAAATANTDKTNSSNNNNTESDSKNDSAANDANNTNEDTDDDDAIQSDGDPKFTTANAKSTKAKSKTMKSKASANARANGTTNGYGAVYGSPLQMQGGFSGTVVGSNTILSSPLSSTSTAGTTQVHLPNDIALFSPPVYSTMVMPRSQVPKNHRTSSSVPVAPAPSTSGDQDEMIPVTIVYLPFYLNDGLSVMRSLTKLSPTAATTSAKGTPLGAGFTSAEVTSQLKQTQATPTNFNAQSSTAVPPASATTGRKAGKTAAPKKGERHRAAKTPYACEKCGKNFISQSKLTRHMLVHTLAKDHGCDICGNRFGQKAALRVHVKRKHGGV